MNDRIRIVADANIPFLRGVLEPYADVRYLPAAEIRPESIRGTDALLIRTRTKCDARLLKGSRIVFIGTATIGYDHIDTAYCEAHGIRWVHAPGCNSSSVAQYVASALLTVARTKSLDLGRTTIGIVGVGHVGGKVSRLARSLGMRVLLNDPPRMRAEGRSGFVDLDALLDESDIITFHVPLTREGMDATHHLADERLFAQAEAEGPSFLNTSRGPVHETRALKAAIKAGRHRDLRPRRMGKRARGRPGTRGHGRPGHAAHRRLFRRRQGQRDRGLYPGDQLPFSGGGWTRIGILRRSRLPIVPGTWSWTAGGGRVRRSFPRPFWPPTPSPRTTSAFEGPWACSKSSGTNIR